MTTIRVRIKIAVWPDGRWTAYGDDGEGSEEMFQDIIEAAPDGESIHWIEANVPMPTTIKGTAAPDMLGALVKVDAYFGDLPWGADRHVWDAVRAAIAKAKGEKA